MTTISSSSVSRRSFSLLGCLFGAALSWASAADLSVRVEDNRGQPVEGAVVTLTPAAGGRARPAQQVKVEQIDQEFVPAVMILPVGSRVRFPNKDDVAHHVYSFSEAKTFDIPLYTGESPTTIELDRPGLVTLGCNIHDWMVAHLFVTEAPYFGLTGRDGELHLKGLPAGDARLLVWHPRLRGNPVEQSIRIPAAEKPVVSLKLRPDFKRRRAPGAGATGGTYR